MPDPSQAHAGHDTLILAAAVDHDPDPETLATIERMTAECPECAAIVDDLRMLATGLAALPAELPAPRDFRITDVQAERLRRGGFLRRLLQPFGIDGVPGLQPLAGALTVVGLAGILLTSLPLGLGAGGAATTALERSNAGAAGGSGSYAAGSNAPEALVPAPAASDTAAQAPGKNNSPAPPNIDTGAGPAGASPHASSGINDQYVAAPTTGGSSRYGYARSDNPVAAVAALPPLTLVSIVVLLVGVVLLSLRLVARRID